MENLAFFRMKFHVPSVLPHRELIRVILEHGLILVCGARVLTDGVISEESGVVVCWSRSLNGAVWHA